MVVPHAPLKHVVVYFVCFVLIVYIIVCFYYVLCVLLICSLCVYGCVSLLLICCFSCCSFFKSFFVYIGLLLLWFVFN